MGRFAAVAGRLAVRWTPPLPFPPLYAALMARPKLRSPSQPFPLRLLLGIFESLASLYLAVAVIFSSAIVLSWATFVESRYGTPAVHFAIYDAWWFAALVTLLGVNVLSAALIRFPWKRYQTGFVITHCGILTLLVGCLLSALGGIDAQVPVFEGSTNHIAFEDSQHFTLKIHSDDPANPGVGVIDVPFASSPFNWEDLQQKDVFPWRVAHRDRGVICDQDGVQLEVLHYLSDSTIAPAEPLALRVLAVDGAWQSIQLGSAAGANPHGAAGNMDVGSRKRLDSGLRIVYWVARSGAETEAFRQSAPQGPLGDLGQIVLVVAGQKHCLAVEELQSQGPRRLGESGYSVELDNLNREFVGVVLRLLPPQGESKRMILFAGVPEFNQQAPGQGVYGSYWVDGTSSLAEAAAEEPESLHNLREPRVDILQGADGRLYYRAWRSGSFGRGGELPVGGEKVALFSGTPQATELYVDAFAPRDDPRGVVRPRAFDKDRDDSMKRRMARVRLTVDGTSEEFWLEGLPATPMESDPEPSQRRVVPGRGRRVAITLPRDQVDVGFNIYLHRFQRKLDPGTSMASHYSSRVDFVDLEDESEILEEDVLITLNEPITRRDPVTGRSFRLYQEAFRGPWKPGHPLFDEVLGGRILRDETEPRNELFLSWLTVNYDPGRGLKYLGCLLIVAGIATMFYMKAYFFRRGKASKALQNR